MIRRVLRATWLNRPPGRSAPLITALACGWLTAWSLAAWEGAEPWLTASRELVFERGELWRLLTATWIHADAGHWMANLFSFAGLAYLLSGYFGFWILPVAVQLCASTAHAWALLTYPPGIHLVGASGGVYAMAAFWLAMYLALERRSRVGWRLVRAAAFTLLLLVPASYDPSTSYRAHAAGYLLGLIAGALYAWDQGKRLRLAEVWAEVAVPDEKEPNGKETDEPRDGLDAEFAPESDDEPAPPLEDGRCIPDTVADRPTARKRRLRGPRSH